MENPNFQASFKRGGTELIVCIHGELDFAVATEFREAMMKNLEEQITQLTLDLSNMTFIDSEGGRVIMEAALKVKKDGGTFLISKWAYCVDGLRIGYPRDIFESFGNSG